MKIQRPHLKHFTNFLLKTHHFHKSRYSADDKIMAREIKYFVQVHKASKWEIWDSNAGIKL